MVQTESRVWSDSGVEPATGDETYTGQERPIAEYDNWAMWAVTKDIDTIAGILNTLELVEAVTRLTFDTSGNRPAEANLTLADDEGWIYLELDTGRIYSVKDDGAGNPVWFQLGIGENDVGSTELATDAVGTTHLQTGSVDADAIATDAVDSAEIAASAVGSSEIATGAVGSDEIADGAIGTADISADAVTSGEIATDAVGAAEISADAVGTSEIDLSIAPTWTAGHTFDAGLSANGTVDVSTDNFDLATFQRTGAGDANIVVKESTGEVAKLGSGGFAHLTYEPGHTLKFRETGPNTLAELRSNGDLYIEGEMTEGAAI